jgi:TRAP-type C4-dicarboxylate transport system permease large subunit
MTEGQKIVLILLVTLLAAGGLTARLFLFGQGDMGSRNGTIGWIAILTLMVLTGMLGALYPDIFPFLR